ncbi:MAG: hypothetical protein HY862_09030 [Chloroflexi bacterium]|nr:hypothetical protein [Chloroflexota bacterium]
MDKRVEIWEQIWRSDDDQYELRLLVCVQYGDGMKYEVINSQRENDVVEVEFDIYADAIEWLTNQHFTLDANAEIGQAKPPRRLTPQEKKRLSYERDHHSMPTGKGASRRNQSELPKLRRRQHRHRLNEYLRRETQGLYKDVSDQTLRGIRPEGKSEYRQSMPLEDAIEEKKRKRVEREEAHKDRPKRPTQTQGRRTPKGGRRGKNTGADLPNWLMNSDEDD